MKSPKRSTAPSRRGGQRRNRALLQSCVLSASAALGAIALNAAGAEAESAKLAPKQPVALFVDLSQEHVPETGEFKPRQFDLNGLPVVVGSGPTNDIGLQAGHSVVLGDGVSLEGATSLTRQVAPDAVFSPGQGMSEMTAGTTARFQQGGWDIALFPEISTGRLVADRLPGYVMGGSVARNGSGGWAVTAMSRYELRRSDTLAGAAETNAKGQFGFTHLPLFGAVLDLGYVYDWTQPKAGTATLSHGPSVGLDLGLSDALNCQVAYRYAFAGDVASGGPDFAWLRDGGQDFTVGWDWDLAAEGLRGTTFSASLAYHQDFFATAARGESSGGINLATSF